MIPKFRAWLDNRMIKIHSIIFDTPIPCIRELGTDDCCWGLDEIILMQSSGLLDKNGKEIFEGDVVKTDEDITLSGEIYASGIFVVEWQRGGLATTWIKGAIETDNKMPIWATENIEVIGNIYENPELVR